VGTYDRTIISEHKRTDIFTADDYEVLLILLADSDLVLTANILTEASNLLWSGDGERKQSIRKVLKVIADGCTELQIESRSAMSCPEFLQLGLTDAGILELSERAGVILTQDLDLHLAALDRGLRSENFTHYRSLI
jgi:hypothetical protein